MRWPYRVLAAGFLSVLVVQVSACSTVKPAGPQREGLLDRLGRSSGAAKSVVSRGGVVAEPQLVSQFKAKGVEFQWPLDSVHVTSFFGNRGKSVHEGIDLRARKGTPVYAAESGVVLYAGERLKSYGKLIVIRHAKEIATVYAHNSKLLVRAGQRVSKGEQIALSGNSGRSSGPHLHFEVRRGVDAVDPRSVLPEPRSPASLAAPNRKKEDRSNVARSR